MIAVGRSLWREPRPAGAAPVGRGDWLLVGAFEVAALIEGFARPGLAGQPFVTLLAMALMPTLLLRRSRPLLTCLIGFGVAGALSVLQLLQPVPPAADVGLYAMMAILLQLYALARWGSGREIALGLPFVAAVAALGMYATSAATADVIGGSLLLLLVVALAAVFRYRAALWQRQQREIRNAERLALARELHDTVAHHVSAIAVQAQAGGVVASTQPQQAATALAAIEAEASRTLAEMRAMVRVLREHGADAAAGAAAGAADDGAARDAESGDGFAPSRGVADLSAFARPDATPTVTVSLAGAVTRLPPALDAAIFRLAQEAVTNAVRHADGATRIEITVRRVGDQIGLRVADDGRTDPAHQVEPGFGLTGMAERAHLLGGSLSAGPGPQGGWVVEALLPARVPA